MLGNEARWALAPGTQPGMNDPPLGGTSQENADLITPTERRGEKIDTHSVERLQ